ncbi:MAG: glycosyltransferase family 39 protein, partial [Pseudomonadota bacterium]
LFVMHSINRPHSFDDAYAIWNLRARFLFRAGENWEVGFSSLLPHSDYPLLIPGSVTRIWAYLGNDTTIGPIIVGMLFTVSTVFLLTSSVGCFRGESQGYLAGMTLLGITYFTKWGACQWADVPLSFYFLANIVVFSFWKRTRKGGLLVLAGLTGGLAAWTKNEGILFLLAVVSVHSLFNVWEKGWRALPKDLFLVLVGAFLPLLLLAYFKATLAPPNDIISPGALDSVIRNMTDASRYVLVVECHDIVNEKMCQHIVNKVL